MKKKTDFDFAMLPLNSQQGTDLSSYKYLTNTYDLQNTQKA